ncbi:MAG: DUF3817 domain-containing protein [Actinomycetota bacterium]|nr:DUF3817 domain-containing protein [Actinomycetota bacterium]
MTVFFRVAALVECESLVVLFVNLATAHLPVITSLGGPTHGIAYLVVVVATLRDADASRTAKALAFVPGIGGLLVLRAVAPARSGARA